MKISLPKPRMASADVRPCEVHGYHWPPYLETEGHHIYPVYLQNRIFGKIVLPDLVWTCDNGHKNIHAWLSFMLGERKRKPFRRGTRKEMELVMEAFDWYTGAKTTGTNLLDNPSMETGTHGWET